MSLYARKDWRNFKDNLSNIEQIQQNILTSILSDSNSVEDFHKLPITEYDDWKQQIKNQKALNKNIRFQPTSGSSNKIKWIPYPKSFTKALSRSANIWMYDLYQSYNIGHGQHYWSLSWLPQEFREDGNNDDSELLGKFKYLLLCNIFCVPKSVMYKASVEESMMATALHLLNSPKLSFISVWSPSFLLLLIEILENKHEKLFKLIISDFAGNQDLKEKVQSFNTKNIYTYWPKLELISAWDTSTSAELAKKVQDIFYQSKFQGKGLWATEGCVTIPFQGEFHLAYTTHYFEFLNLKSNQLYNCWDLKLGDRVSPVITTQSGFLRYQLQDELEVVGFNQSCPQLNFITRLGSTDMVGEKISNKNAQLILEASHSSDSQYLLAVYNETRPYYCLVAQRSYDANELEDLLLQNFHYKLAREFNQLAPAQVLICDDTDKLYEQICSDKKMIIGNIKREILIQVNSDERLKR
jgi:hypothetical protein